MPRRLLVLALLLAVETGCPHAWGRDGTIEMALRRDLTESRENRSCKLSIDKWRELCRDAENPILAGCPPECRYRD
jgi:hypothetical protein